MHCNTLQHAATRCNMLQLTATHCSILHGADVRYNAADTSVCCSVLQCVAVCCSVLQMHYSVMQCDAVCCSVLQCVAVRCSVLQWIICVLQAAREVRRSREATRHSIWRAMCAFLSAHASPCAWFRIGFTTQNRFSTPTPVFLFPEIFHVYICLPCSFHIHLSRNHRIREFTCPRVLKGPRLRDQYVLRGI